MQLTRRTLLAGLLAAPLPRAAEEQLALGPALFTFGELAEKLSLPERPIRCVGSLREHGAFVCLKARPPAQVEKLLLDALDLTLVPSKDGVYLLQRTPTVATQEREWQRRVTRQLEASLQSRIRERKKALAASKPLSYEESRTLYAELMDLSAREIATVESKDATAEETLEPLRERMRKLSNTLSQYHSYCQRVYELGILEGFVRRALDEVVRLGRVREARPISTYLTEAQFLELLMVEAEVAALSKSSAVGARPYQESYSAATLSLRRTGRYLQLRLECEIRREGQFQAFMNGNIPALHIPDKSPYTEGAAKSIPLLTATLFQQEGNAPGLLGAAAQTWFAEGRKRTQSILSQPRFQESFALTTVPRTMGYQVPRWLSQAVEVWCQSKDSEAIMELYPLGGEYLSQTNGDGVTPELTLNQTSLETILQQCCDQWGVEEKEGVYLFRNHLAFLDRGHSFPLTAFLRLYQKLPPDARFEPPVYPLIAEYCRVASRPSEASVQIWVGVPPMDYRNVRIDDLDAGRAFLPLWESLSEEERQQAMTWHDTGERNREQFRIPLTRFADEQILQMAQAMDLGYLLALHPDLLKRIREDSLIISSYRGQPHRTKHIGPAYDISLRLERTPSNRSARFLIPAPPK